MKRALQLATRGRGFTSPNPMVGAVIVHNGKIIGEGYHRQYSKPHAEVNAVNSVKNKALLQDSTIYVTLEPCSHYGKTPPCAQLIIDNKIPRVVIGCLDPFEKVRGRGVEMMQKQGIDVTTGILENECIALNARFITAHTLQRPWVTLKWAQSADGYIDHNRQNHKSAAKFSTPITSTLTHQLRSLHDGIMVGNQTINADNPRLNTRLYKGRSPRIIVVDRQGIVQPSAAIFESDNPVIYFTQKHRQEIHNSIQLIVPEDASIQEYLTLLYQNGITSILVEGGATLLQQFIDSDLWDMARVETAPFNLAQNGTIVSPKLNITPTKQTIIDGNQIDIYCKNNLINIQNLKFCNFV